MNKNDPKNDYSIWLSIIALLVSLYLLYIDHLKSFSLEMEEGSRISIANNWGKDNYIIGVPIILINKGAQGGVIKKFIFQVNKKDEPFTSNGFTNLQVKDLVRIRETETSILPIYLKGNDTFLINIGTNWNKKISNGQYDCEIAVILPNGKRLEKFFFFNISKDDLINMRSNATEVEQFEIFDES
jgi:hypothetical protein